MGVPMPAPNYGRDDLNRKRGQLVKSYGLSTVIAAENAAVLDLFIKAGFISASEYADMVEYRCQQVDQARQDQVGI